MCYYQDPFLNFSADTSRRAHQSAGRDSLLFQPDSVSVGAKSEDSLMLVLALGLGLGLTTVLLGSVARRRGSRRADLGAMSDQWIAAYNASPHSSSV